MYRGRVFAGDGCSHFFTFENVFHRATIQYFANSFFCFLQVDVLIVAFGTSGTFLFSDLLW
jgi:hypothetical protein